MLNIPLLFGDANYKQRSRNDPNAEHTLVLLLFRPSTSEGTTARYHYRQQLLTPRESNVRHSTAHSSGSVAPA